MPYLIDEFQVAPYILYKKYGLNEIYSIRNAKVIVNKSPTHVSIARISFRGVNDRNEEVNSYSIIKRIINK